MQERLRKRETKEKTKNNGLHVQLAFSDFVWIAISRKRSFTVIFLNHYLEFKCFFCFRI